MSNKMTDATDWPTKMRKHGKNDWFDGLMYDALDVNAKRFIYENMVRGFGYVEKEVILANVVPEITNVVFNNPATIVFWADGTKTVVKANNEAFDQEKGLVMAIAKKAFGNKGNYFNKIKEWTESR